MIGAFHGSEIRDSVSLKLTLSELQEDRRSPLWGKRQVRSGLLYLLGMPNGSAGRSWPGAANLMKVLVTKEEMERLVLQELERRGYKMKQNTVASKTHTEGQWEDFREIFDGIEVELED